MEVEEVVRRVAGRHWRLIAGCVALAVLVVTVLVPREPTYTSTARLVLDNEDPTSRSEASVIADTARAIATSPQHVRGALSAARADRDAAEFAAGNVTVSSLGSSSVLELSVTDRDAAVAAAVANTLADRVIRTRLQVTRGFIDRLRGDLSREVSDLNRRLGEIDALIDRLTVQLAQTRGAAAADQLRLRRDAAVRRRNHLAQARSVLEGERASLLGPSAPRQPRVISAATLAPAANESGMTADLVLAVFLGFVLGIGVAGLIETLRPTLVGERAVARALGLPVLASLSRPLRDASDPAELASLALHLRLAAKAAHVRSVRLVAVRTDDDLAPLAARLDPPGVPTPDRSVQVAAGVAASWSGLPSASPDAEPVNGEQVSIQPFDAESALRNGVATGLVVVAPDLVRASELRAARQLLEVSPSPTLGAVVYQAPRRRSRAMKRKGLWRARG